MSLMDEPTPSQIEAHQLLPSDKPVQRVRLSFIHVTPRKLLIGLMLFVSAVAFISQNGHLAVLDYTREKLRNPHPYLDLLFPQAAADDQPSVGDLNARTLQSLMNCLATNTCGQNQTSVVLLADFHFSNAVRGHTSGEDIWAQSVHHALDLMGYSFIFCQDLASAAVQYRMFPDLIKVVIAEGSDVKNCFEKSTCVKTAKNTLGIPIWKMFSFHFWDTESHPLGRTWTLSPEDYRNGNQYLGYSLEAQCTLEQFIPTQRRRDQVYILAKRLSYFFRGDYPWAPDGLKRVVDETGLRMVGGFINDTEESEWPEAVVNYGQLYKEEFFGHISHSRALLGIGTPMLSPSPYDALCMGVPFVNPIKTWDRDDPQNRSRWWTQHDGLKFIEEPYVYHVQTGDTDGLVNAINAIKDNPIDRYIPPTMTQAALQERLAYLVEHDWRSDAQDLLASRLASGEGTAFVTRRSWRPFGVRTVQDLIEL